MPIKDKPKPFGQHKAFERKKTTKKKIYEVKVTKTTNSASKLRTLNATTVNCEQQKLSLSRMVFTSRNTLQKSQLLARINIETQNTRSIIFGTYVQPNNVIKNLP